MGLVQQAQPPTPKLYVQQSPRVAAAAGQLAFFEKSCILY
jgi:hypothetical protein